MKYGFSLVVRGNEATPDTFAKIAECAEVLKIDSLWCSAHIVLPPQVKSGYVMVPGLKHPDHWKDRYWQPFTVLSYLAAKTRKLILGTSVVVLPMHDPFEVAKQAAEVDQLSAGRFVLGIGVGWFEEEFDVLQKNYHDRGSRTNEALELMKVLWSENPVTFKGRYYSVQNACFGPKPLQQPGPPVWVAGNSKAALKRAARYADAWHPARLSLPEFTRSKRDLNRYLDKDSRSAETLELTIKLPLVFQDSVAKSNQLLTQGRPKDIISGIERYQEVGVSHFVFDFVPETLDAALITMEKFSQEVRPYLV